MNKDLNDLKFLIKLKSLFSPLEMSPKWAIPPWGISEWPPFNLRGQGNIPGLSLTVYFHVWEEGSNSNLNTYLRNTKIWKKISQKRGELEHVQLLHWCSTDGLLLVVWLPRLWALSSQERGSENRAGSGGGQTAVRRAALYPPVRKQKNEWLALR